MPLAQVKNAKHSLGIAIPRSFIHSFAGMAELADAQDLGSCVNSCRFDPCYPHQNRRDGFAVPSVLADLSNGGRIGAAMNDNTVCCQNRDWPRSVAKPNFSRLCVVATRLKSSCPHQISTVIMIRNRIVKAVLAFYREALIYKAFSCFGDTLSVCIKITRILSADFLRT